MTTLKLCCNIFLQTKKEKWDKIFIDVKKSLLGSLLQLMFKLVIYVICDIYEFLNSLIFNFYPIPQLNCKFESFAVSLQCMTLFVNFKQKMVEKTFFTLINGLGKTYYFKFFKGCLPQILLGPFLNTLTQMKS